MNASFGLAEQLKCAAGMSLYCVGDRSEVDDGKDCGERAMWLMGVFVRVRMHCSIGVSMFVSMALHCAVVMGVWVGVFVFVVRVISCGVYVVVHTFIMVIDDDVDLGAGETAAHHFARFEPCSDVQLCCRLFEERERHTRIDEGAKQHVAADAGEAF